MTDTRLLVGSLSNDLFRVATLTQRGSTVAAVRFAKEAKKWALLLEGTKISPYVATIAREISSAEHTEISMDRAEKYLMYGVLLQNYALHAS